MTQSQLAILRAAACTIDEIYRYPLRESAKDRLNRQLCSGIDNDQLAKLVIELRADDRLCVVQDETEQQEPQIICSLRLFEDGEC